MRNFFFAALAFLTFQGLHAQKPQEPINSGKLLEKIDPLFEDKDYEGIVELMDQIPRNDTNYLFSLYLRSYASVQLKKYEDVIEYCSQGRRLESEWENIFYIYEGASLDSLKKYDEAISVYEKGIQLYPYNDDLLTGLGYAYYHKGEKQKAIDVLKRSIRCAPLNVNTHYLMGLIAFEEKRPVHCILAWEAFLINAFIDDRSLDVYKKLYDLTAEKPEGEESKIKFSDEDYSMLETLLFNRVFDRSETYKKIPGVIKNYQTAQAYFVFNDFFQNASKYKGFYAESYGSVFGPLVKKGWFDEFALLSTIGFEYTVKGYKTNYAYIIKKKAAIDKWYKTQYLPHTYEMVGNVTMMWEGKEQAVKMWYGEDGDLNAIGNKDASKKEIGYWEIYFDAGSVSEKLHFDAGKANGAVSGYYPGGEKKYEANYKDGNLDGVLKSYYRHGALKEELNFKDGKREGICKEFFKDGTISFEVPYEKGIANGKAKYYHPNNKLKYEVDYKDGEFYGSIIEYHPNGTKRYDAQFVDGKKSGQVIYYFDNGKLQGKYEYKEDELNGPFETYYENGQMQSKGGMKKGKLNGLYQSWYRNGKLEEENQYDENGKGNGIQKSYREDGSLFMESETKKEGMVWYKIYDEKGKVIGEGKEDDKGKLVYEGKYETGEKFVTGEYLKGKEEGVFKYFDKGGNVNKEESYKEGKIIEEKSFYSNGSLAESVKFNADEEKEGPYESFYFNGKHKETGWFIKDERVGYWIQYHADGTLDQKLYFLEGTLYGPRVYYTCEGKISSEIWSDEEGKDFRYITFDTLGKELDYISFLSTSGELVYSHMNKAKRKVQNFKADWRQGKYQTFYINGQVYEDGQYINGEQEGKWMYYYSDGTVLRESYYKDGYPDSVWKDYHINGKLSSQVSYVEGKVNGEQVLYYEAGQVSARYTYVDSELEGPATFYSPEGEVMYILNYKGNILISVSYLQQDGKKAPEIVLGHDRKTITTNYKNGKKSCEFSVNRGFLDGTRTTWYPNGQVMSKEEFKGGIQEGLEERFFANGKVKSNENYLYGDYHGVCLYYDQAGNVEREFNYLNGTMHGIARYYEKGKLVKTRWYHDGWYCKEEKK
jgi:antitoxin component YwqK of YwqJK toxin-antitoxin module